MKQLSKIQRLEESIKKSTFMAIVAPVLSVDEALSFLKKYSQAAATHNCWAYNIGQNYRYTDDGEPSGTAGMPILKAIQGQDFDNTIAVVIRYYGGIKLGTGGLMRAYGGCVNRCLQNAEFTVIKDMAQMTFSVTFPHVQAIHNLVSIFKARLMSEDFNEQGAVFVVELESPFVEEFKLKAVNITKGLVEFQHELS